MIKILCTTKVKSGPEYEMTQRYLQQIRWPIEIITFQAKKKTPEEITKEETSFFEKHIQTDQQVILLDELGQNIKSTEIAKLIDQYQINRQKLCFIIGGTNGIAPSIRKRANHLIAFGKATWPHLLCRLMLIEQLYRAQCILNNHPYHREGSL